MKNTFKIGDEFTIDADKFKGAFADVYNDCTAGKTYTATGVGEDVDGEAHDVAFIDDVGDTVNSGFHHLTKV